MPDSNTWGLQSVLELPFRGCGLVVAVHGIMGAGRNTSEAVEVVRSVPPGSSWHGGWGWPEGTAGYKHGQTWVH